MIKITEVSKQYKLNETRILVPLRDVNLDVAKGECIVIFGRSGAGKTTLLNLIAGLIKPTAGQIRIDGADLDNMPEKQLALMRNQKIGFVFQFPSLFPALTVLENTSIPSLFGGRDKGQAVKLKSIELLTSLGLEQKLEVFPRQLSAGEQRRVVLARALINDPPIVLADEPTSDLDEQTENEIVDQLKTINSRGVTFVIATHNTKIACLASRVFKIETGTLKRTD